MNGAGVLAYANLRYGSYDWIFVRQAIEALALPYDPLPAEPDANVLAGYMRQIPDPVMTFQQMRDSGREGLITVDDYGYRQSTQFLSRVELPEGRTTPEDDTWLEALQVPDGRWLLAPQVQAEAAGIYFIRPVAQGPQLTRLVTLDTGTRADGTPVPASDVLARCERGVDDQLKWTCLQGTCTGHCEPTGWKAGAGPAEISGCRCL
jgi:hypothetical protein